MGDWAFRLSIGYVNLGNHGRRGSAPWSIVASIGTELTGLGAVRTGRAQDALNLCREGVEPLAPIRDIRSQPHLGARGPTPSLQQIEYAAQHLLPRPRRAPLCRQEPQWLLR